jgi:hypothetical protein
MEPTDLNSSAPDDARLEAWYRANLSAAPLPDDGFTRRVLVALPNSSRHVARGRLWYCLAGAALGTVVAALGMASSQSVSAGFSALGADVGAALVRLNRPEVGCAVVITLGSLWLAFRPRLRLLPRL